MIARRSLLSVAFSFSLLFRLSPALLAQDAPDVDTGKHQFVGEINASDVFVRSGPREDAYPTRKLDKGAKVTVVGMKFNNWLKILPPEGSFAYVPQVHVMARGDGKVGRAAREMVAYAGSSLNPMKIAPMGKVGEGEDVQIIDKEDEYFKIKPPVGSFLYVNKLFVDPVRVLQTPADPVPSQSENAIARKPTGDPQGSDAVAAGAGTGPTTRGAEQPVAPATQPAESPSMLAFGKLEADFTAANDKPITEQPLPAMLSGYQALLKDESLPPSMRRIAEVRIATLNVRSEARDEFLAVKDAQGKMRDRQKSMVAEREEIEERIKQNDVKFYTVVGTLRPSSLQRGSTILYRLTDPSTGRTIAYIRSNDAKYAGMFGSFIGIHGTLNTEAALNMKVVDDPTGVEVVDPAKVNTAIAAQLVPPSLMPKSPQQAVAEPQ